MKKKDRNKNLKFGKKSTTNMSPDTHKAFCRRCKEYNGRCPRTGGMMGCDL